MNIHPITLEGKHVRLEPLSFQHFQNLCEVGLDNELWKWTTTNIQTENDLRNYIQTALNEQREGKSLPFAIIEIKSNKAIGSTRYGNIDTTNRRVEIGWTWLGNQFQRTVVNTETKYILLTHAFESWKCIRVEFKTDSLNEQSRNALLRIGAKEEGVFRKHLLTYNGRIRHSVYYSIIDSEWNGVKMNLEEKLKTRYAI